MPRRKPVSSAKAGRARKDASDDASPVASAGAPESLLRTQRSPLSDMERAVKHVSTSEETGEHGADNAPDVGGGFMEPQKRDEGTP